MGSEGPRPCCGAAPLRGRGRPACAARECCRAFPLNVALLAAALLVAVALGLAVPHLAHADGGGSVGLGISVKGGPDAAAGGSVELGAKVAAKDRPAAAGDAVELAINVRAAEVHQVSFVGYYCDEAGDVVIDDDGSQKKETIEVQDVRHGGHAALPGNLVRTSDDGVDYWVDGWYAYGPDGSLAKVDLASYEVTGGATLVCYWKRGYVIRLDANNGSRAADFKGEVPSPGCITVPRDGDYDADEDGHPEPAGVEFADVPKATRPGYVFKGWYWGETLVGVGVSTNKYGQANLDEGAGCVVDPDAEGELSYRFVRDNAGRTLYAKWELAPVVEVRLQDGRDAADEETIALWFWPGRGYATTRPVTSASEPNAEVAASVVDAPGAIAPRELAHNPLPPYSTQYFCGWGYGKASSVGGSLVDDVLVSAVQDASGSWGYALTARAFGDPYVGEGLSWKGFRTEEDAATGAMTTVWDALFETAHIRVKAPFEVTFQKKGAGYDEETNPGAVEPYGLDELECSPGETSRWIQSLPQRFTNLSDRDVYVSGVEVVDVGASAILPGGIGKKPFRLYCEENSPAHDPKAIAFGYTAASSANQTTVSAYDPDAWIVLRAPTDEGEQPARLFYGLDLVQAAFDRSAIAVGDDERGSYVAKLANVKYTYSVA